MPSLKCLLADATSALMRVCKSSSMPSGPKAIVNKEGTEDYSTIQDISSMPWRRGTADTNPNDAITLRRLRCHA